MQATYTSLARRLNTKTQQLEKATQKLLLAPFLDTYPESVEYGSARKGNSGWSAGKLLIRVVADEEIAGYG